MTRARLSWISMSAAALAVGVGGMIATAQQQKASSSEAPEALMGAALHQEEVEGNLEAAIATYKKVIADPHASRALAARALLQVGKCYEKLGNSEARQAYERVVREFAEQTDLAVQARARLSALTQPAGGATSSGLTVRRVWASPGGPRPAAVSPDGRFLAYADSESGVHLLDLAKGVTRPLLRGASDVVWGASQSLKISPDGRQLAYVSPTGCELRLVALGPGPSVAEPDVLYPCGDQFVQLDDWSRDGKQILARTFPVFSNSGYSEKPVEMISIAVSGRAVRLLKRADREFGSARFSPDGRYIAYDVPTREDPHERDIFLLATDGSGEQPLVESPGTDRVLDWAPDGAGLLFASDRTASLSAYLVRVVDGRPERPPVLIKRNIEGMVPLGFTRSGTYFYRLDFSDSNVYIATVDPATGRLLSAPIPANPRSGGKNLASDWSPDGQHLAFISRRGPITSEVEGEPMAISILSLASGRVRELRPKLTYWPTDSRLRWSPDGRSLLTIASDDREENWGLYRIDTDSGAVVPVLVAWVAFNFGWAADGKAVVYGTMRDASGRQSIRLRDLATGADRELYGPVPPSFHITNFDASPDGRSLAFGVGPARPGAEVLYVMPVSGGSPRELLRVDASSETSARIRDVTWTPDGRHLLFNRLGTGWRISVEGGAPQRLDFALTAGRLHPDGRRIAFTSGSGRRSEIWVMENFLPPLKAGR